MDFWNRRRMQKGLGIMINLEDLTEPEALLLEYCESTYSGMMERRKP